MYTIINKLAKTSSTKAKQAILEENKDDKDLQMIFEATYNPFKNYYLKKIYIQKIDGSQCDIQDCGKLYQFFDLLDQLNQRKITGNEAIDTVELFLSNFNIDSQELMVKIIKRDLRCNVTATTANKVWPNLIPEFDVQLADKYDEKKEKRTEFYASPKLDGLRCMFIKDEGLFTRNGHKIVGFEDTIEKECQKICDENKLINAIDGELFSKKLSFEDIQGSVMRNKNIDVEDKKQIYLNVFAILINFKKQEIYPSTSRMVNDMKETIGRADYKYVKMVEQKLVSKDEIDALHDKYVEQGYEGLMLRDVNVSYAFKRSKDLLKFKKFQEDDFKIVGTFEGEGKYAGMLGGIIVEGKGLKSEVGSGFNDAQRTEFWKNRKELIGALAEIKYQNITTDGSLRFPIFRKLKEDR